MSENDQKNTVPDKDPDVVLAPTLHEDTSAKKDDTENDPLAKAIEEDEKKKTEQAPKEESKDKSTETKEKPVNPKSQDKPKVIKTQEQIKIEKRAEPVLNDKGERKLTPEEVLAELSFYDDFEIMRGWEMTKFKFEFDKLKNGGRILDVKATKEFLLARGHKV